MDYPNRIRELREERGLTLEELASSAEISVSYLSRLETGERNLSLKTVRKIAAALRVSDSAVIASARADTGERVADFDRPRAERVKLLPYDGPSLERGAKQIPVYAAAQGGRGHHLITFDPIEYRSPIPDIVSVRGAYGILITGESMVPAFRPGDIAWVHPHRPPERDSEVVLYHVPPAAEAEAIIKTLVRFTPSDWVLRQYQPEKEWTEPREDWPVCHLIVGRSRGR